MTNRRTLEFICRRDLGPTRYYPNNQAAYAIVGLAARKCLSEVEVERLKHAGFEIVVLTNTSLSEVNKNEV